MNYNIRLFLKLDDELKGIWYDFENNSYHVCFNSLAWIENYILSFKKKESSPKLRIFIISVQNKPVCILPFEIVKKYGANVLQWACDSKSDFNSPLQKKNFNFDESSFKKAWNEILKMLPEVDLIYFKKQINYFEDLNNPFINFLKNSKEGVVQQILLPSKWDDYTKKTLNKKFHLDLLRTKRLIKKSGKVEFVIAKNNEEKKNFINVLIAQKKEKLKRMNIDSMNESDLNFYKNFENYENKQYFTHISALKLNGEFIAVHWGIVTKDCYYYLLPSMKENGLKKFSPGKLLLSLLIKWSISKKLKIFDFGLGEELYKEKWTNKKTNIYNYIGLNNSKGIFFYLILRVRLILKFFKKNKVK